MTARTAPGPRTGRSFDANVKEWLFFTEVLGMSEEDARRELRISDRCALRYKRHAETNRRVRKDLAGRYPMVREEVTV